MWLEQRAPFVPMGSLVIWTMISWPSFTTSRIGVDLESRPAAGAPVRGRRSRAASWGAARPRPPRSRPPLPRRWWRLSLLRDSLGALLERGEGRGGGAPGSLTVNPGRSGSSNSSGSGSSAVVATSPGASVGRSEPDSGSKHTPASVCDSPSSSPSSAESSVDWAASSELSSPFASSGPSSMAAPSVGASSSPAFAGRSEPTTTSPAPSVSFPEPSPAAVPPPPSSACFRPPARYVSKSSGRIRSSTCRNAALSRPMSTKAAWSPGRTRVTFPRQMSPTVPPRGWEPLRSM